MTDETQAEPPAGPPRAPGEAAPLAAGDDARARALEADEASARAAAALEAEAAAQAAGRRALIAVAACAGASWLAIPLGQTEASLALGGAALFAIAHGADVAPRLSGLARVTSVVLGLSAAMLLAALVALAASLDLTPVERTWAQGLATGGALVALATMFAPATAAIARRLFRTPDPGHADRLAAQTALVLFLFSIAGYAAARPLVALLLEHPEDLINAPRLIGGLLGNVALAFMGIGLWVRRDLRASLERLGLEAPRPRHLVVVALGLGAMLAAVAGLDAAEAAWFPELRARDQGFVDALSGLAGPGIAVTLGLSAGIGEELTLRGALQPRFGVVLTALLFAVLHVQYSWFGILSIFVIGVMFGVVRRLGGTTSAIAIHVIYDTIVVLASAARPA